MVAWLPDWNRSSTRAGRPTGHLLYPLQCLEEGLARRGPRETPPVGGCGARHVQRRVSSALPSSLARPSFIQPVLDQRAVDEPPSVVTEPPASTHSEGPHPGDARSRFSCARCFSSPNVKQAASSRCENALFPAIALSSPSQSLWCAPFLPTSQIHLVILFPSPWQNPRRQMVPEASMA